jgi:biopolymer transport protein TolR
MKSLPFKKKSGPALKHEINVTPFVDVMLVLLIIFMVAAPMMTSGVEVDLPTGGKSAQELSEPSEPITITIDASGACFLKDKALTLLELMETLSVGCPKDQRIYLRADQRLSYAQVMQVMTSLKGRGYSKIALLTTQEP